MLRKLEKKLEHWLYIYTYKDVTESAAKEEE